MAGRTRAQAPALAQVNSAAAPLQNLNMAAQIPIAPVIVKPATKIATPKFTEHEANGAGTKLLQEEVDAYFALCGTHEMIDPL